MFDQQSFVNSQKSRYLKNVKAMEKKYPKYAEEIRKTPLFNGFHLMPTGSKEQMNVYSIKDDSFLYDLESPINGIHGEFSQFKQHNVRLAVLMGIGLGYELNYFADNILVKNNVLGVVLVEKHLELFKLSLYLFDYTSLFEADNIFLLLGDQDDVFTSLEKYLAHDNQRIVFVLKTIKFYYSEKTFGVAKDYYSAFMKKLHETVVYILQYFGNDPEDSLIGVKNMLANIEEIIKNPGINLLYNKFKGKPAVIVSTGPSLNKNKHLLKEIKDKALIISPDASLKILHELRVHPHMLTSLERIPLTYKLLEGFKEEDVKDVFLAASPVVVPEMYQVYPGPRIIVYRNFDHFKWLKIDRGILNIKHSSGNMAFKLAEALGCSPIILIGQDLAYSREGTSHASGATLGEQQLKIDDNSFEVMGNDGAPILTNKTWNMFRQAYEVDISTSKAMCINATEGGAYIKGTTVMSFKEAIDQYITQPFDALDIIKKELNTFDISNIEKDTNTFMRVSKGALQDLKDMKAYALEAVDYIQGIDESLEEMIKKAVFEEPVLKSHYAKVAGIRKKIDNHKDTYQLLLVHTIQSYTIHFENDLSVIYDKYEDVNEAVVYAIKAYQKWFGVLHEIIGMTEVLVKSAYEKVINVQ